MKCYVLYVSNISMMGQSFAVCQLVHNEFILYSLIYLDFRA